MASLSHAFAAFALAAGTLFVTEVAAQPETPPPEGEPTLNAAAEPTTDASPGDADASEGEGSGEAGERNVPRTEPGCLRACAGGSSSNKREGAADTGSTEPEGAAAASGDQPASAGKKRLHKLKGKLRKAAGDEAQGSRGDSSAAGAEGAAAEPPPADDEEAVSGEADSETGMAIFEKGVKGRKKDAEKSE